MNDKQLAALFMTQLLPAVQVVSGLSAVKIARSYQSRTHGAAASPYIYFYKIGDHRYGHPQRKEQWDAQAALFTHTETQLYETTYQFMAWAPQDPTNVTALTESDILDTVCGVMQGDAMIQAFLAQSVGILRVTDVRNPYIVDDRDQFAATPSFDVTLIHPRTLITTMPAVVTQEFNFGRV